MTDVGPKEFEQALVCYYRGQRVEDMSHEDLISAVKTLGKLYSDALQTAMSNHKFYNDLLLRKAD